MQNFDELRAKTYFVRPFGCQMNMHDAERVCGLLEAQGCIQASNIETADIVVFMTCCVRENADDRLYGQASSLGKLRAPASGKRIVAVGGCLAQRDGQTIRKHAKNVNVVFGTQTISRLPELIVEALHDTNNELHMDIEGDPMSFSTELPSKRESKYQAWVPIMTGCNNFCSYCIVPYVRGREHSRELEDVVAECQRLVDDGVREITLLGQNVNSYGQDRYGSLRFAELLEKVAETGIDRIRFTSSHPKDLSDETIEAMAKLDSVVPHLHLAVQSGSTRILKAMNRKYTREQYIELARRIKTAMPNISLTTDIIVGFPGETEEDFLETMSLVDEVDFDSAYTFIYSAREGTPAAKMQQNATHEEIQDRYERLLSLIQKHSLEANQRTLNQTVEVLVEGASKQNEAVLVGHSAKNQTVHFAPAGYTTDELVGKLCDVKVNTAKTWYLQGDLVGEPH